MTDAATQQKQEPAWKLDGGKSRIDLIAPEIVEGLGHVLRFGADKYAARNWEAGMSWGRCFGAAQRHLWAWQAGEANDPESGLPHLWHAACCIMFLGAFEHRGIGTDDRTGGLEAKVAAAAAVNVAKTNDDLRARFNSLTNLNWKDSDREGGAL